MFRFHEKNGYTIAELAETSYIIKEPQDILDLMADLGTRNCSRMILYENCLSKEFFDLKTKVAGEILQKCSNYHFRLAIIGDFSKHSSKSLADFIRESNRGSQISFVYDIQRALEMF